MLQTNVVNIKHRIILKCIQKVKIVSNVVIWVRMTLLAKKDLNHFSISSTRDPHCKNDIQLFLQQFEKSGVNGDTN